MRKFLDAVADSYFEPRDDGTVRFALVRPENAYVTLSEAEAEGLRPIWRTLVWCHVHAAHLFALVGIFAPWIGLLLLLILWFGGVFLELDFKSRWGAKVTEERDHFRKVYAHLCRHLSRRWAIWLGVAALLAILPGTALVVSVLRLFEPGYDYSFFCYWIVAIRWALFFFGIAMWSRPLGDKVPIPHP